MPLAQKVSRLFCGWQHFNAPVAPGFTNRSLGSGYNGSVVEKFHEK
jgi:hypothetical protein